jgi:hypothetical protein
LSESEDFEYPEPVVLWFRPSMVLLIPKIFKYPEPMVLWFGRFSNIQNRLPPVWGAYLIIFFHFFLCSQHVPFKFPMDSHQVLNTFPRFPMCSPRVFRIAPCFNPICFAQSPPLLGSSF